jgi:hypothetical protein
LPGSRQFLPGRFDHPTMREIQSFINLSGTLDWR